MMNHLKEEFLKARKEALESGVIEKWQEVGIYNPKMLRALKNMAQNDVYPDEDLNDIDVDIWLLFRRYD